MAWFIKGLRHEVVRLEKKHKRIQDHELLILNDIITQNAEGEEIEMLDTIAAPNDTYAEAEDSIFIKEALSILTPRQQKVIKSTILEERTECEVAKRLGISQPVVHRLKERALKRLRKHFAPDKPTAK